MTNNPDGLSDARAVSNDAARGPLWREVHTVHTRALSEDWPLEKYRQAMMATLTPPASDAAVPAGHDMSTAEGRWKYYRSADSVTAAAPKVASDTGAGLAELVKPFADYHGDLPDYDHPLRPTFESGIQYAVELLAKELGVKEWVPCDGTEEFDGDLGGTLMNIVLEAMPKDEDGDPIHPRDLVAATPTDATDGATGGGEVQMLRQALAVAKRAILKAATDTLWCDDSPAETVVDRIDALIAEADGQGRLPLATTPGGNLLEQAERDHNGGYTVAEVEAMDDEPRYLIRKGGAYYRKNSQGYTDHREAAGRYRLDEAIAITHPNGPNGPRDGMDYVLDTAGKGEGGE